MEISQTTQHFLAGIAGGSISTAALYPLELVKTRMQVIDTPDHVYRTIRRAIPTIIRNEGFRGLYQGLTPAVFAASGSWGGYFYFYESSKNRKIQYYKENHLEYAHKIQGLSTVDFLLSGVEGGAIMVFIFNPVWVVKTRLALQGAENSATKYKGMSDALRTIAREEGIRGLYKGLVPALFLTSHGAIQFAAYESMKSLAERLTFSNTQTGQPAWVSLLTGGASKIMASCVTYPYQVIKSKLQQREFLDANNGDNTAARRYRGTVDCVLKTWRREGAVGFFRGLVPNILKVTPSSAVTFLIYEETLKLLKPFTPKAPQL